MGLSLEKQQRFSGWECRRRRRGSSSSWGQWAGFGFAIKITSGSVSAERFWKVGGLSEASGGAFPILAPGGIRMAGD